MSTNYSIKTSDNDIYAILTKQLNNFWTIDDNEKNTIKQNIKSAILKTQESYNSSSREYYHNNGFSVLNSTVYTIFLYHLSHSIGTCVCGGGTFLADKIYYLNKIMNCIELYWNIELPPHFIVDHPLGTVLGKAKYGDFLSVYQGVTVGGNVKNDKWVWPELGDFITLYSNATVIGESVIGNNVIISANTVLINETIPDNCIVFGKSPNIQIKHYSKEEIRKRLVKDWIIDIRKDD